MVRPHHWTYLLTRCWIWHQRSLHIQSGLQWPSLQQSFSNNFLFQCYLLNLCFFVFLDVIQIQKWLEKYSKAFVSWRNGDSILHLFWSAYLIIMHYIFANCNVRYLEHICCQKVLENVLRKIITQLLLKYFSYNFSYSYL